MFSRSRLLFSLVAILFISTLALADSAPVSTAYFHSSAGVYGGAQSYSAHVTSNARTATPAIFTAFKSPSPSSYGETSIAHVSAQFSGNERFQVHGTVNRKNGGWGGWGTPTVTGPGSPSTLATPEPGSLMLLSTGLVGIAGTLRRKSAVLSRRA